MPLDPAAHIQSVHLTIPSLERSVRFYEERIGLRVHRREGASVSMGADAGAGSWLVLHEQPSATRARRTTGLYHFAILVPSRPDLARTLRHLTDTETPVHGFADHLVSEAIYLADPDGNGIEIYRDRPREAWPRKDGALQMASDPLDVQGLLAEADPSASWTGLAPGTHIGHVHLHVAHLAEAEQFYRDALGLDLIQRYDGSATFFSAGGYHHHMAVNTWAGVGAPAPPPGSIGLRRVLIRVPDATAVASVQQSLTHANVAHEVTSDGLVARDPSGNVIVVTAP